MTADATDASKRRGAGNRTRLRNRCKARYELRQGLKPTITDAADTTEEKKQLTRPPPLHLLYESDIKNALRKMESGAVSYFSSKYLWENREWITITSIPLAWVSTYKIYTLGNARLGEDHVRRVLAIVDKSKEQSASSPKTTSLYEYTVWLGEYRLLNSLIAAGCLDFENVVDEKVAARLVQTLRRNVPLTLSSYVVKRIVEMRLLGIEKTEKRPKDSHSETNDGVPRPQHDTNADEATEVESSERQAVGQLCFGPPCFHSFSESIMWNHVLVGFLSDGTTSGSSTNALFEDGAWSYQDIVTCPVCCTPNNESAISKKGTRDDPSAVADDAEGDGDDSDHATNSSAGQTLPQQVTPEALESIQKRHEESLKKYQKLPANARELKRSKTVKPKRLTLTTNWQQAVAIGRTQEVRTDKWFAAAEGDRGFMLSFHTLLGCLRNGMDVNVVNGYGQTAMHVVLWRWKKKCQLFRVIHLLLEYGADPNISAHGGATCWNGVAMYDRERKPRIEQLLQRYCSRAASVSSTCYWPFIENKHAAAVGEIDRSRSYGSWQSLIAPTASHPGAGSYMIDDAISDDAVDSLLELHQVLPVAADAKRTKELCSDRSYYCDAHGHIRRLLEPLLQELSGMRNPEHNASSRTRRSIVLPLFRFLHYRLAGTELAAHQDLCRVFYATDEDSNKEEDPEEQQQQKEELRSTHTLILYLTDCPDGGETRLLQSLHEKHKVLAQVQPQRGRLFVFPHMCPHAGATVGDAPKILLRGEVYIPGFESEY